MTATARISVPAELLDPARAVREPQIPGVDPWRRGKVRSLSLIHI